MNEVKDLSDILEGADVILEMMQTAANTADPAKKKRVLDYIDKLQKGHDVYNRIYIENLSLKQKTNNLFAENQNMAKEIIKLKEEINQMKEFYEG